MNFLSPLANLCIMLSVVLKSNYVFNIDTISNPSLCLLFYTLRGVT